MHQVSSFFGLGGSWENLGNQAVVVSMAMGDYDVVGECGFGEKMAGGVDPMAVPGSWTDTIVDDDGLMLQWLWRLILLVEFCI